MLPGPAVRQTAFDRATSRPGRSGASPAPAAGTSPHLHRSPQLLCTMAVGRYTGGGRRRAWGLPVPLLLLAPRPRCSRVRWRRSLAQHCPVRMAATAMIYPFWGTAWDEAIAETLGSQAMTDSSLASALPLNRRMPSRLSQD